MSKEKKPRKTGNRLLKWATILLGAVVVLVVAFRLSTTLKRPVKEPLGITIPARIEVSTDTYVAGDSWFRRNDHGLWELSVKGTDLELGVKIGLLTREQIQSQEEAFVRKLKEMVPSKRYLGFLKQVVAWMNRDLDHYIPEEYQREIYGVALQASDTFNFIGPAYQRILNYHSAHDIGHALQNMNLVACTAFSVKDSLSADGRLLVGRNFDFSLGDEFARNKIIAFYDPSEGYRFASITWGGMIGVVSGMNECGLVVTLNAAKSGIPGKARTPVSILARKILQYASNIEEAREIAEEYETFVAESFLISSARDHKTVVIEKSPHGMDVYDPGGDRLILTNHFQGELFRNSDLTLRNKAEGASVYRWNRALELLEEKDRHDPESFAAILRDRNGMGDEPIGLGNEKAVNQLVAHHSVIFSPEILRMWISTNPYQLGAYLCYDLNRIFSDTIMANERHDIPEELIPEDPFLHSITYAGFVEGKKETQEIREMIHRKKVDSLDEKTLEAYLNLNPYYYYPYFLAGEVCQIKGERERAGELYRKSLSMEIPRTVDRDQVAEALEKLDE